MAIGHIGRYVNLYKEDGTWIELVCDTELDAAQLAHDLSDYIAEMIIKLQQEEEHGPVPGNQRVPRKVRINRANVSKPSKWRDV